LRRNLTRVLVTGAAGFIGSHVADHCLANGCEVVGVDDLSGGFIENVSREVDLRVGSVVDPDFVASLWSDGRYDFVYHLAAYAAEGLSHFIRRYNYQTNLVGSVNLINQSVLNNVGCFVFTSSIAVYGRNQTPMAEDLIPRPEDPYGISKYAVELDLKAAHEIFGLEYVVFRPHNVYGERQNIADTYRNVIGIFMNQLLRGEPMTIFGDASRLAPSATSTTSPRSSPVRRRLSAQGARSSMSVPTSRTRYSSWPERWPRRSALRHRSSTFRLATKSSMPSRPTTRSAR
jgi:UDP-glucose 4-epimerase